MNSFKMNPNNPPLQNHQFPNPVRLFIPQSHIDKILLIKKYNLKKICHRENLFYGDNYRIYTLPTPTKTMAMVNDTAIPALSVTSHAHATDIILFSNFPQFNF